METLYPHAFIRALSGNTWGAFPTVAPARANEIGTALLLDPFIDTVRTHVCFA